MLHQLIEPLYRHGIPSWTVADPTALAALVLVPADIGRVAIQVAPFNILMLTDDSPATWASIYAAGGSAAGSVSIVDAGGYYTGTTVEAALQEIGADIDLIIADIVTIETHLPDYVAIALSDETTALTTGTNKVIFHMPFAMSGVTMFVGLSTPQASGSIFTVDVNKNGATILSTKLTVDNTEGTSLTAATPAVLTSTTFAKGDKVSVDIDQVGTGAAGAKLYICGLPA